MTNAHLLNDYNNRTALLYSSLLSSWNFLRCLLKGLGSAVKYNVNRLDTWQQRNVLQKWSLQIHQTCTQLKDVIFLWVHRGNICGNVCTILYTQTYSHAHSETQLCGSCNSQVAITVLSKKGMLWWSAMNQMQLTSKVWLLISPALNKSINYARQPGTWQEMVLRAANKNIQRKNYDSQYKHFALSLHSHWTGDYT